MLTINNLNVYYHKKNILSNINLEIKENEIIYILGPSGCGKTSLLNTIAGFIEPSAGTITLNDKDITTLAPQERDVSMVFQDFALFPNMSVEQNILFAMHKVKADEQQTRLNYVVQLMDIENIKNHYPHEISGGQAQRVALARSLVLKPKMILFDEVFSSLDEQLKYSISKQVRDILKAEKISAIFVSHDQKEALSIADKIAVIDNGNILQFDTAYNTYHKPKTKFVANFIGDGYFIDAVINDNKSITTELGVLTCKNTLNKPEMRDANEVCSLLIRPDDILHDDDGELEFKIIDKTFYGQEIVFVLELPSGEKIPATAAGHHNHTIGSNLKIKLDIDHIILFSK